MLIDKLIWKEVNTLKKGIHPDFKTITVTCACGNTFETGSVDKEIRVEICSECHPFFTGKQKFVDKGGRVDKFKKKYSRD
jgi:large subunit ribosomal protein L31